MVTSNEFDMVFDCQQIFKNVMNALARPGKIFSVTGSVQKITGDHAEMTAIALSLLDSRCKYYVCEDEKLQEEIREKTMAFPSQPEEADFLLIPACCGDSTCCEESTCCEDSTCCGKLLANSKRGTLAEPHKSAFFIIELPELKGEKALCLTGPGIKDSEQLSLSERIDCWITEREKQNYEFPCGVDMVFCTPAGEIMGIPRTTKVRGE